MSDANSATESPLVAYFAAFASSSFSYRPARTAHNNFHRLCKTRGWIESLEWPKVLEEFHNALVQEFNFIYGTDRNDLNAWHKLCRAIGIQSIPDTVDECRKLVWDDHVNIVDLIDTWSTRRPVQRFASLGELTKYTTKTKRFFPKKNAYQGELLKDLLREIIQPYFGRRRNGSEKKKRRRARRREAAAGGT